MALFDVRSMRLRVLAIAAVTIGVTLMIAGATLVVMFERHLQRRIAVELDVHWAGLAGALSLGEDGRFVLTRPLADPRYEQPLSGTYWQVTGADGAVMRSRSLWDAVLAFPAPANPDLPFEIEGPDGAELYVLSRPVRLEAGGAAVLTVAIDHKEIVALSEAFSDDLRVALGLIGLALFAGALVQTGVGLAPLRQIRRAVADVRGGRAARLGDRFASEMQPLADDLDRLLDSHEQLLGKARDRAGALAHGFKTPLTILKLEAAALEAEGHGERARVLREQVETMRRHVEQELARVRTRGIPVSGSALGAGAGADVASGTRRLLALIRRMPHAEALEFDVEIPERLQVRMDRDDFGEVLGNLLDNARKWARSRVAVRARAVDATSVSLEVADDGPGFGADADHAAAGNAEGSGLGLAIVRDILAAYGTGYDVERRDGETVVRLLLTRPRLASA
ncbi:sensor histidine kinase [Methylobrevis albus]|uniref:histidine kinase n=1 Tax=Methylobrevis albus TaxID=2793297 RepID=A0A931I082_9HYPH|nr:HAMP domain-containing sensor histidine kinase [Methylobrevis albus]MBH0237735.1 HAMP domain-containing histidine kinase [Methylobrevis albus]